MCTRSATVPIGARVPGAEGVFLQLVRAWELTAKFPLLKLTLMRLSLIYKLLMDSLVQQNSAGLDPERTRSVESRRLSDAFDEKWGDDCLWWLLRIAEG